MVPGGMGVMADGADDDDGGSWWKMTGTATTD